MSVVTPTSQPGLCPEPVFPLTVEQYHAMIDAGVLTDDDPVELLEGVLVFKMPKKSQRRSAVRRLVKALEKRLPDDWFVMAQEPITLRRSEPEPHAAVVKGSDEEYAARHPGPADVALVVEVADTTVQRDRNMKLRAYAAAGIGVYWIVNLVDRTVEVYTEPDAAESESRYRRTRVFAETDAFQVEFLGRDFGSVAVADLLPPRKK